ncbi:MAG: hypothetical protein KGK05_05585 [Xanthomonadaceae bacterium]|nr:hypothetical protein [Xanthomonadaceae bacterium]
MTRVIHKKPAKKNNEEYYEAKDLALRERRVSGLHSPRFCKGKRFHPTLATAERLQDCKAKKYTWCRKDQNAFGPVQE